MRKMFEKFVYALSLCVIVLFTSFDVAGNTNVDERSIDLYVRNGLYVDIGEHIEIETHSLIQLGYPMDEYCSPGDCSTLYDGGIRIFNILSRLKLYTGSNSYVFGDVALDVVNRSNEIFVALNPELSSELEIADDVVEQAMVGIRYKRSEVSIGKHLLSTDFFGPTILNNYLDLDLSGFSDDRIDPLNYPTGDVVSATTVQKIFGKDFLTTIAFDVEGYDDSKTSVDYNVLVEAGIPNVDNVVLALAAKSLSGPAKGFDLTSSGAKINIFTSGGSDVRVAFTQNDFGKYLELLYYKIFSYRHRIGFGVSDFVAKSGKSRTLNSVSVNDTRFVFLNYTFAVSRLLDVFVEYDEIDDLGQEARGVLVGINLLF